MNESSAHKINYKQIFRPTSKERNWQVKKELVLKKLHIRRYKKNLLTDVNGGSLSNDIVSRCSVMTERNRDVNSRKKCSLLLLLETFSSCSNTATQIQYYEISWTWCSSVPSIYIKEFSLSLFSLSLSLSLCLSVSVCVYACACYSITPKRKDGDSRSTYIPRMTTHTHTV